jgi:hypothetical protein
LSLSDHIKGRVLLVLVTGTCLAANAICSTERIASSNRSRKSISHATASTVHSSRAKKQDTVAASRRSSNRGSAAVQRAHANLRSTAKPTSSYRTKAATLKRRSTHTSASASGGRRYASRPRPSRSLTGLQRLARLHLEPDRVQEIQKALIREGYLPSDGATGEWDSRTHDAMLRYQTMHGFPATGLPEAKALMKLGLGSHPLPPELDRNAVGIARPNATPNGLTTPTSTPPPVSESVPPS